MILGVTGHRPDKLALAAHQLKLSGTTQALEHKVDYLLSCVFRPKNVLIGMALGFDTLVARSCVKYGFPFWAYVPCEGQERLWPAEAQREYHQFLHVAAAVIMVRDGEYTVSKMQLRNEKIVDDCTDLFAGYDGTKGGTFNTVQYALEQHRHTYRLNPRDLSLEEWGG